MQIVLALFGTRPEIIKLAPVLRELKLRSSRFQTVNVASSQHVELLHSLLPQLGIALDHDLAVMEHDQSPSGICQRVLAALIASQHSGNGWVEVGTDDDAERLRASARRISESPVWGTFQATTRTGLSPSTGQRVLQVRFAELHGLTLEHLESDDGLALVSKIIREANDAKA